MGSMTFRVGPATPILSRLAFALTQIQEVARVESAVKGGRSPAKQKCYSARDAHTLKRLDLVVVYRGQIPSLPRGEAFPRIGTLSRGGGTRMAPLGDEASRSPLQSNPSKPPEWSAATAAVRYPLDMVLYLDPLCRG